MYFEWQLLCKKKDVLKNQNFGILPVLFKVGNLEVSSYSFFVLLGIIVGVVVYYFENKKLNQLGGNTFLIAICSVLGGVLGAKLLEWIVYWPFNESGNSLTNILINGKTIIGGMLGGLIGSKSIKYYLGIKDKRGNQFAPAVALGLAVGRIGCFLHGCCYGKPTNLPWAVNFGDNVLRHPTQLYESIYCLILFVSIIIIKKRINFKQGELFTYFLISYFVFRFFVEFIRTEKIIFLNLSAFQVIAIFSILYLSYNIYQLKRINYESKIKKV